MTTSGLTRRADIVFHRICIGTNSTVATIFLVLQWPEVFQHFVADGISYSRFLGSGSTFTSPAGCRYDYFPSECMTGKWPKPTKNDFF